jgi:hypothetical protein
MSNCRRTDRLDEVKDRPFLSVKSASKRIEYPIRIDLRATVMLILYRQY